MERKKTNASHHHRAESASSREPSHMAHKFSCNSEEAHPPGVVTSPTHTVSPRHQERKNQWHMFQAVSAALALIAFCTLAGWLLSSFGKTTRAAKMPPFCCPYILQDLYEVMNRSKNPCNDFYHYACYAWRENRSSAVYQRLTEDVVRPIFQLEAPHKEGSHPSAKVIGLHYRSCIEHGLKGLKHAVNSSVLTIIQTLKGVEPRSSGATMLKGVVLLSAEYYLTSVVEFLYFPAKEAGPPLLGVFLSEEFSDDPIPMDEIRTGLVVFNEHYGTDVAAAAIRDFDQEIRRRVEFIRQGRRSLSNPALLTHSRWRNNIGAHSHTSRIRATPVLPQRMSRKGRMRRRQDVGDDNTESLNLSNLTVRDLGRAIPTVPQETWKDVLVAGGYWHDDAQVFTDERLALTYVLGVLTNSSRQQVALALIVTMAAASLDLGLWPGLRGGGIIPSKLCENITDGLSPLWDVALTHALTTPAKDATVRAIYDDILNTIKGEAKMALDPSDVIEFNGLWNAFRLLLPSDRSPQHISVTLNISKDATYPEYNLAVAHYWVFYDRFQEANGYPYQLSLDRDVYNTTVVLTENYVFIPPAMYALLKSASGTDRFINMAILGVQIADVVWTALMHYQKWHNATRKKLDVLACSSDRDASAMYGFRFPWLTLWTTVKTSVGNAWRSMVDGWGLWEVSRSQIFHILVFYHHVCRSTVSRTTGERLSAFMRTLPDFSVAFNCDEPNRTISCLGSREEILSP